MKPATCLKHHWPNGTILELVELGKLGDVSEEVLDRLVSKIPVDGKKYTLPEVD